MILESLKPIADLINKFIPDGAEKNRLAAELEKASMEVDKQRLGALSNMLGSNSFFVAGAIPAILWILVLSIFNNYILMPWFGMFGQKLPDVSLPGEVWNLAGWIITGLLAKKAVDGNAFYSKDGTLIKPSRSDEKINTLPVAEMKRTPVYSKSNDILPDDVVTIEPDQEVIVKDQAYYDQRFSELVTKYGIVQ